MCNLATRGLHFSFISQNSVLYLYIMHIKVIQKVASHLLGQEVDSQWVFGRVCPQLDLSQNLHRTKKNWSVDASCFQSATYSSASSSRMPTGQYLVGEGVAHDEGGMSHGAAQVDQPALSQDDDVVAVFQQEAVDLRRRRQRETSDLCGGGEGREKTRERQKRNENCWNKNPTWGLMLTLALAFLVNQAMSISQSKCPMLQTMESSFMFSKWLKDRREKYKTKQDCNVVLYN